MALGSVHGRRHRKKGWMKRKKPTYYGSPSASHVKRAAKSLSQMRFEEQIIRGHLRDGQCRAAINGLVHLGEAAGKASAHKSSASMKRQGHGRSISNVFVRARRLSEQVAKACVRN